MQEQNENLEKKEAKKNSIKISIELEWWFILIVILIVVLWKIYL